MNTRALTSATILGTALQLLMVIVGHFVPAVASLFAAGGMTISVIAGVQYARLARGGTRGDAALGGLVAGGGCALLGIIVSYVLKDVPAMILVVGTLSSAISGMIGGWVRATLDRRRATA
jgi:hypothetical protein